jgi:hypothetical protein
MLRQASYKGRCGVTTIKLKHGDCLEILKRAPSDYADSLVTDPPAGISFMGKDWDSDKGGRDGWVKWMTEVMAECLRVLKPGGHALVWAIPRTSHWTMSSLEDAGFEIRDVVTHLFGSGFPKSLDVSKAIDKAAGAKREVIGQRKSPYTSTGRNDTPSLGKHVVEKDADGYEMHPITAPATPDAEKWQGFGTALKPAAEFWILCRKPLGEKTVAANVLKHGTGALNIDGCRIGTSDTLTSGRHVQANREYPSGYRDVNRTEFQQNAAGRFPANLVLSCECTDEVCEPDCAVRMLDEQTSHLHAAGNKSTGKPHKEETSMFGIGTDTGAPSTVYADSGGASRFFYVAKASKRDKGADNTHPTVKSTALMRYLIKLVTPPGGLVLDPFMGSGSTGVAALAEGFGFVGIEQSEEYFDIASSRLTNGSAA